MRLNKTIRREISDAVIHSAFNEKEDALNEREKILAAKALKYVTHKTEELGRIYEKIPKSWFPSYRYSDVNINGEYHRLFLGESTPMPQFCFADRIVITSGDLQDEILDHVRDKEALIEEKDLLTREVWTILNSVTTVKRLLEEWPEVRNYVPGHLLSAPPSHLPAVQIAAVNEHIERIKGG